jgi:hypothetical protein
VREGVIAPFLAFVPDNGFKTVCQMKWVNSITLPQSESIILTLILIPTTSERYSASLCWELNTKVDIQGEKGFFGNPD